LTAVAMGTMAKGPCTKDGPEPRPLLRPGWGATATEPSSPVGSIASALAARATGVMVNEPRMAAPRIAPECVDWGMGAVA
jgi:hypothetical protein